MNSLRIRPIMPPYILTACLKAIFPSKPFSLTSAEAISMKSRRTDSIRHVRSYTCSFHANPFQQNIYEAILE